MQVSQSGDEASFLREGNVLSLEESWGCCPYRPEFVLAYTPTSPLELRLCHQDLGDPCERACSGVVSFDLTRAFSNAGTTEFRFVD